MSGSGRSNSEKKSRDKDSFDVKGEIAKNIGRVGDGVSTLGYVMLNREITSLSRECFEFVEKVDALEELQDECVNLRHLNTIERYNKRIADLNDRIDRAKKKVAKIEEK